MTGTFAAVSDAVRERVVPTPAERERLADVVAALSERTRAAIADLPVAADVEHVGSTARGTWLRGDRDIDLFVRFSADLGREELAEYGLRVGHEVLGEGHEEYAEHPYVVGEFEGYDVDLVPCYRVADATAARSAVDRTPFHNQYLAARLDSETVDEVRLCKQFLVGTGAYGSNLRTEGFSGYLTELLVLEYGGFRGVVEALADWRPPVELDPAGHGETAFDDPLVVVDPTDPGRNVAAVVSAENVARVQHYARSLLADPRESVFERSEPDPLDAAAVRDHLDRRGTTALAVTFPAPDLVDDNLYPQLRRSLSGLVGGLQRRGFEVLRSTAFAADRGVLLVELAVAHLPAVECHEGPPVHAAGHAADFHEQYVDDPDVYGPFLDGDRYVVERERAVTSAAAFAREHIEEVALGAGVERAIDAGHEVLVGDEVATLAGEFGVELARYFAPRP
jgi:tRNA nucleotidyltransferase (CCA-adding enzyme)